MGGLFKKKFDAAQHLDLQLTIDGKPVPDLEELPEGALVRLETTGLAAWEVPELEMVGVPTALADVADMLVGFVASAFVADKRRIKEGYVSQHEGFSVRVGAFPSKSPSGKPLLRLADLEDEAAGEGPPRIALATLAFAMGSLSVEEDPEPAVELWKQSIALYPGAPSRAGLFVDDGQVLNDQNFVSWFALACHDGDELARVRWYEGALERSLSLWRMEFGTPELPPPPGNATIQELLGHLLSAVEPWDPEQLRFDGQRGAELMTMTLSPLVEPTVEGGLSQAMAMIPFPFRAYFYEPPVRERLASPEGVQLIGELYAAAVANPNRVLARTLEVRNLYLPALSLDFLRGDDGAPRRPLPLTNPAFPALSRLAADVGRLFAAELTADEVRAHYGLLMLEPLRALAAQKLERLRSQEGRFFALAVGMDLP